jgi:DNA-directed RNA polymerase subunit beta
MASPVIMNNFRARRSFAKIAKIIDIPNLIDIQKQSYEKFLQKDIPIEKREDVGLQGVFKSVFPIKDFSETSSLEFVSYTLDKPKYDVDECRQRGMTFAAPIKVIVRLVVWDTNEETGSQSIRDVKEQEVFFGEIPLMTDNGTFIINGTERVVVSQLHRSPGVFYDHDKGKTHSSGKLLYSARIIPYRGSWLDFEFDPKDLLYVRIDRRRKLHATVLLRALGYSTEELLNYYYDTEIVFLEEGKKYSKSIEYDLLPGQRASRDIRHPDTREILVKKNRKFTKLAIKKLKDSNVERLSVEISDLVGKVAATDVIDEATGEVILQCNEELTESKLDELREHGIAQFKILFIDNLNIGSYLRDTLIADKLQSPEEAILEIYRRLRPGDPPTLETAQNLFNNLFFNAERYDLSKVGRLKLNYKFKLDESLDNSVLTKRDILETIRYLIDLKNGKGAIDDIDHLGNRRVRAVGELMENQYRIGLVRMERAIKERMSMSQEIETLMPHDLINAKPVSAVVKEYFGSSQLSQFMDQTNPLSEVTHKRRLSALGPGGLTRERAGFEVRDVHGTHYGRICPIETPEGPNIGLIASLSTYARVNEFGFIETPYRTIDSGATTEKVEFYSALQEEGHYIAQSNTPLDKKGKFTAELIAARHNTDTVTCKPEEATLMDVSPNQLVSVAASLIPFLENDDANRALMGSNMQRQAVPLIRTRSPLIGTGIEGIVARDSGVTMVARRDGVVDSVDATRIVVRPTSESESDPLSAKPDIYNLTKFQRSNQNTCINQKPIIERGDHVKMGEVIADGPATERGELALGENVLVAFMPWGGYNFEDSILVSEHLVKNDHFTSIHIEEFECVARDTKLGKEEITCDIPNVGEEALKDLDESGIVRIGAEVKPQDILVGKITPKGETQLSPEEKLLRAIFGEKAGDVRDSSLRVPPGVQGIVISAKVFSRKGTEKDERAKDIEDAEKEKLLADQRDEVKIVSESYYAKMRKLLVGKTTAVRLVDDKGKVLCAKGQKIENATLDEIPSRYWSELQVEEGGGKTEEKLEQLAAKLAEDIAAIEALYRDKISKLTKGDELPPGVIKMVKVYVAIKRKLSVGDKMAGRHGNKGVVSRVLPEEDMPFLADGSPVGIVLNPLGVPSRMNVGQILETHLGGAALYLGKQIDEMIQREWTGDALRTKLKKVFTEDHQQKLLDELDDKGLLRFARTLREGVHLATPVFDGAKEVDIKTLLAQAGLQSNGQATLFDGKTGEAFDHDVTVGVMYMLKLHHLVDDKIHARSIGPYSLVTQQPLGGKAQFGGQRLGEMEVWAMEAYGAAYGLQEFLTVKSDDVIGRTRMYEAIVKGEHVLESGLPESFNVLLKELQSLCLNVELIEDPNAPRKQESTLELMAREVAQKVSASAVQAQASAPAPASELGGE